MSSTSIYPPDHGKQPAKEFDYAALSDAQLIDACGDDGMKWAIAFCQVAKKHGHDLDPGWLVGWFANAIETADMVRRERARPSTRLASVPAMNT